MFIWVIFSMNFISGYVQGFFEVVAPRPYSFVSPKDQALCYNEGILFSTCIIEILNTGISRKLLVRSSTTNPEDLLISTLFRSQFTRQWIKEISLVYKNILPNYSSFQLSSPQTSVYIELSGPLVKNAYSLVSSS